MIETTGLFRPCLIVSIPCLSLIGCGPSPPPVPPAPVPIPAPTGVARALLDSCNSYRASKGLVPLSIDSRLVYAAQSHADRMAQVGRLAHQGIGDGDPFSRIRSAGYAYRAAGEVVASGYADADAVMRAWQGDAPHRAILLGSYADCGGACARGGDGALYWCMDFGSSR